AIALEYLRQGAYVGVNYYAADAAALDDFLKEGRLVIEQHIALRKKLGLSTSKEDEERLITVPGDISKPETGTQFVSEVVKKFGDRLDIFVSNAGVCEFREFLE
ncbi:hypothetical protein KEM55_002500, partial [Ascosphaera atra]